jgi:protein ImuB
LATVGKAKSALRLMAVDEGAAKAALHPGLTARDARRREPALLTAPHDPVADTALVRRLLGACRRFTPALAESGDALTLDVTGAGPLFGGEGALLAAVEALFADIGVSVAPGLADTPTAAWTLARFSPSPVSPPGGAQASLAPLPVEALRRPGDPADGLVEDLRGLGVRTLGQAWGWPRETLAVALDAALWIRLDELAGLRACPLAVRLEPVRFAAERRLTEAVSGAEAILHHARRLAEPVCDQLRRRRSGGRGFVLRLFGDQGRARVVRVASRTPLTDPAAIAALFARRLEAEGAGESTPGVALGDGAVEEAFDHLRLEARPVERLDERTGDLLGEDGSAAFETFRTALEAKFGLDVVQAVTPDLRSAKPEREVRFAAWGSKPVGTGPAPPPPAWGDAVLRPLRLFARPEPIRVLTEPTERPPFTFVWRRVSHRVVRAEGPERLSPEWGREAQDARTRDYYRVEDERGRRFWIFREGFFVEDAHGEEGAPAWFLHGLFA